jgi:hypothetical protein
MFCCVLFSCVLCQYRILQNLVLFITLAIYCSQYVWKEYTYRVITQLNSLMFVWKMKECPLYPYFRMWVCACMQRCNTVCRIIVFLDFVHCLVFEKTCFGNWVFLSSGVRQGTPTLWGPLELASIVGQLSQLSKKLTKGRVLRNRNILFFARLNHSCAWNTQLGLEKEPQAL